MNGGIEPRRSTMPTSPTSKLSLSDLMILILATGFGLGCYVMIDNSVYRGQRYFFGLFQPLPGVWSSATLIDRAAGFLSSMLPLFGLWTLAFPIIVWRRPRPTRHRSMRGPGMTACVSVLVGLLIALGVVGISFAMRRAIDGSITLPANFWSRGTLFDNAIIFAGVSVASAWVILFSTGRWHPRPEPIDRLGRALGGLWLLAALVFATRPFLH
jgi:hypothetical protein